MPRAPNGLGGVESAWSASIAVEAQYGRVAGSVARGHTDRAIDPSPMPMPVPVRHHPPGTTASSSSGTGRAPGTLPRPGAPPGLSLRRVRGGDDRAATPRSRHGAPDIRPVSLALVGAYGSASSGATATAPASTPSSGSWPPVPARPAGDRACGRPGDLRHIPAPVRLLSCDTGRSRRIPDAPDVAERLACAPRRIPGAVER